MLINPIAKRFLMQQQRIEDRLAFVFPIWKRYFLPIRLELFIFTTALWRYSFAHLSIMHEWVFVSLS